MNFKKPREEVLNEVLYRTDSAIRNALYNSVAFGNVSHDTSGTVQTLTHAITLGIVEAVRVTMENTYTDSDFEEDLGIRDKPDTI